jgi:hypothetical protein
MQAVDDCSQQLRRQPYDPESWLRRASSFLDLNYPELATSDAYKASLLLDQEPSALRGVDNHSTRSKIYDILGQALYDCHCHWELADFWEAVSTRFPSSHANDKVTSIKALLSSKNKAAATLGGTPQEQRDRIRDGGVGTVDYPWTKDRHLVRSRELIDIVNEELAHGTENVTCYLGQSTLSPDGDMLGMYAARDIQPGEGILLDRTATGACSSLESGACDNCYGRVNGQPVHSSCCTVIYCSSQCRDLASNTYHKVLCGHDFTWLQTPAKNLSHNASPLRPLLMLRFIATFIQAGPQNHPLDHPLIARLQPLANRSHIDVFTFAESVVTPIRILEQLGIDVFANHNFDTMVLHTVWTRIANNKAGSFDPRRGFIDEISPHLPLFNHSCEPNVEWRRGDASTTIWFFAKSKIKKGDELFSSYLDVEGMGLQERTEALWPWFEGVCLCAKCVRDRAGLVQ